MENRSYQNDMTNLALNGTLVKFLVLQILSKNCKNGSFVPE
jgi:hypothetical protein